jgi:hypothetical protein
VAAVVTFVFMMICVVALLFGLCFLTYAMRRLLMVVQDTAAGCDEVFWSAEPFQDAIGGAFHLTAVVLIVLAPVGILARALREVWLPDDPALRFLLLAVPGLWLFLPVALLSSLSASSRWFVMRPIVVWNLLRLAPFTFLVYLFSAILAVIVAALAYVTVVRGWFIVAPLAAAGTAAAFLIYGRLLGRLAWKMGRLSPGKRGPRKKVRPKANSAAMKRPKAQPSEFVVPEETASEWETTPYGQKRRRTESYGITHETPPPSDAAPDEGFTALSVPPAESITEHPPADDPTDFDRIIRKRTKRIVVSQPSLLGGVFAFPLYKRTRLPWFLLSMGFLAAYGLAYVIASLYLTMSKIW